MQFTALGCDSGDNSPAAENLAASDGSVMVLTDGYLKYRSELLVLSSHPASGLQAWPSSPHS